MANTILPGYMTPMGAKYLITFDHTGPTSYVQGGVNAALTTGGDVIKASDIGVGGFDYLQSDVTDKTGQLYAFIVPVSGGGGNATPTAALLWYSRVTATVGGQAQTAGNQVVAGTNLSTFALRIQAWCV